MSKLTKEINKFLESNSRFSSIGNPIKFSHNIFTIKIH